MGAAERQQRLLRILCRRRHDTMSNLANELGVSLRTIRRDVETLSLTEPVYTMVGRYGGGVYIDENYRMDRMYLRESQYSALHKAVHYLEEEPRCPLSSDEMSSLHSVLTEYGKPRHVRN